MSLFKTKTLKHKPKLFELSIPLLEIKITKKRRTTSSSKERYPIKVTNLRPPVIHKVAMHRNRMWKFRSASKLSSRTDFLRQPKPSRSSSQPFLK